MTDKESCPSPSRPICSKSTPKNVVSAADQAVLEERYEFVPSQRHDDDADDKNHTNKPTTWQDRMVERYNDCLYREYALADLSRPGQLGLRWRTRQEVLDGRGEKTCGNKRCCGSVGLVTMEVPFAYQERGTNKRELVKLRLCPTCLPQVRSSKSSEKAAEKGDDSSSRSIVSSSASDDSSSQERRKRKKRKKKSSKYRTKKRKKSADSLH